MIKRAIMLAVLAGTLLVSSTVVAQNRLGLYTGLIAPLPPVSNVHKVGWNAGLRYVFWDEGNLAFYDIRVGFNKIPAKADSVFFPSGNTNLPDGYVIASAIKQVPVKVGFASILSNKLPEKALLYAGLSGGYQHTWYKVQEVTPYNTEYQRQIVSFLLIAPRIGMFSKVYDRLVVGVDMEYGFSVNLSRLLDSTTYEQFEYFTAGNNKWLHQLNIELSITYEL